MEGLTNRTWMSSKRCGSEEIQLGCVSGRHLKTKTSRRFKPLCSRNALGLGIRERNKRCCGSRRAERTVTFAKGKSLEASVGVSSSPNVNVNGGGDVGTMTLLMGAAILVQSVALVGAFVGGFLARNRRIQLENLNTKLRQVNAELRKKREMDTHVCEADGEVEAMKSYRAALEMALDAPAAAHPIEKYGREGFSLAQARREFSRTLQDSKEAIYRKNGSEALSLVAIALKLSKDIKDYRAQRSALKVQAQAHRSLGNLENSLKCLTQTLELSKKIDDSPSDVDVLGEIADIHADMGDYEKAATYYDQCIVAIKEDDSTAMSPYWDC